MGKEYTWHGVPVVSMLTGSICGGLEAAATWPNEVIKTELQMQRDGKYKGVIDCFQQKVRTQGVLSLYRGLFPIVVGSMPKAGIRFGGYNLAANQLADANGKMGSLQSAAAGTIAGTLEAIFAVTPLETLKTRLINRNLPFFSGTVNILRAEGLSGIYKGVVPTVAKQSLNQATRFVVYNKYTEVVLATTGEKKLSFLGAGLGGMFAGAISSIVNQPVDTIKTRMQGVGAEKFKGSLDCVLQTVRGEGVMALYKGLIPRLGRVVPGQGIIFGTYNQVSPMVERLFTGDKA
jgi:solute carrier family 25 citrate transporter 1